VFSECHAIITLILKPQEVNHRLDNGMSIWLLGIPIRIGFLRTYRDPSEHYKWRRKGEGVADTVNKGHLRQQLLCSSRIVAYALSFRVKAIRCFYGAPDVRLHVS
jgi:hypothetical protein